MKKSLIATLMLISSIIFLPIMINAQGALNLLNQERMKIGRALLEMQSDNWTSLVQYYTHDIEYHDPIVSVNGIEEMTQFLARLFSSSPNLVTTIEDEICIQGIYGASWIMEGYFNGVPYKSKGITIFKFHRGSTMVYYQRDYYSEGDIMANIPGLDEAINGFRMYYRCAVDPTFDCPLEPPAAGAASNDQQVDSDDNQFLEKVGPVNNQNQLHWIRRKIGRALVEINSSNWTSLLQYYTHDINYSDPIVNIKGIEVMAEFLAQLFANSPNLITTVEDEICIDDIYMATWIMEGYFNGIPYTAKGMSIIKFRPGEIQTYYSRDYYTEGDIMIHIPGLDEATEGFRIYYKCSVDPTFDCPLEGTTDDPVLFDLLAEEKDDQKSETYKLQQNVPNPFNPSTIIYYDVPNGSGLVTLKIYDMLGREVMTLVNEQKAPGSYKVNFNASNLPSGLKILFKQGRCY